MRRGALLAESGLRRRVGLLSSGPCRHLPDRRVGRLGARLRGRRVLVGREAVHQRPAARRRRRRPRRRCRPDDAPAGDVTAEPPPSPDAPAPDAAPTRARAARRAHDGRAARDGCALRDGRAPCDGRRAGRARAARRRGARRCRARCRSGSGRVRGADDALPRDGGATICANVLGDTFHCGRCEVRCCQGAAVPIWTCTDVRCPPLQTACTASRPTAEAADAPCRDLQSDDAPTAAPAATPAGRDLLPPRALRS